MNCLALIINRLEEKRRKKLISENNKNGIKKSIIKDIRQKTNKQ